MPSCSVSGFPVIGTEQEITAIHRTVRKYLLVDEAQYSTKTSLHQHHCKNFESRMKEAFTNIRVCESSAVCSFYSVVSLLVQEGEAGSHNWSYIRLCCRYIRLQGVFTPLPSRRSTTPQRLKHLFRLDTLMCFVVAGCYRDRPYCSNFSCF
jgi:hypothetical protein